jgi:hypothetical protein
MNRCRSNLLSVETLSLENRIMLAAGMTSADEVEAGAGVGRERGERGERGDRRSNRDEAGSQTATAETGGPLAAQNPRQGVGRNLGELSPIAPIVGQRVPFNVDEGPSSADILSDDAISADLGDRTFLGFVGTGTSLFVNVPTEESIAARRVELDSGQPADRTRFQPVRDISSNNGFTLAGIELVDDSSLTLSPDRAQQIENTVSARLAEENQSVSFVNNFVQGDINGPVTLFINLPNDEIDALESVSRPRPDRAARNFTYEEITNGRFSVNDFREGDTLTVPGNIARESRRLLGISTDRNVETSVAFNPDGSTFNNQDFFDELAPVFEAQEEVGAFGDGSTLVGSFDGLVPLSLLDSVDGPTRNVVADIHTHPQRSVAFRPFDNDAIPPDPSERAAPRNSSALDFRERVDLFISTFQFGEPTAAEIEERLQTEGQFRAFGLTDIEVRRSGLSRDELGLLGEEEFDELIFETASAADLTDPVDAAFEFLNFNQDELDRTGFTIVELATMSIGELNAFSVEERGPEPEGMFAGLAESRIEEAGLTVEEVAALSAVEFFEAFPDALGGEEDELLGEEDERLGEEAELLAEEGELLGEEDELLGEIDLTTPGGAVEGFLGFDQAELERTGLSLGELSTLTIGELNDIFIQERGPERAGIFAGLTGSRIEEAGLTVDEVAALSAVEFFEIFPGPLNTVSEPFDLAIRFLNFSQDLFDQTGLTNDEVAALSIGELNALIVEEVGPEGEGQFAGVSLDAIEEAGLTIGEVAALSVEEFSEIFGDVRLIVETVGGLTG